MKGIVTALVGGVLVAGCATEWVNPNIADGPAEERQLAIDNGYCTQAAVGSMPPPAPRVYRPGQQSYLVSGSTTTMGPGGPTYGTFHGSVTSYPSPAQSFADGFANGAAIGEAIRRRAQEDAIYEGCMLSLGWDEKDDTVEATTVAAAEAPSTAVAASPPAPAAAIATCADRLVRRASTLSEEIASLGGAARCSSVTVADGPGSTLAAEGYVERGADTPRLMAMVTRSDQPFDDFAAISGREGEVIAGMTGGSVGDAEPLPVQSHATVDGHRLDLAGFTVARSGDPLPYACVVASDRTTETMVAAVCRSAAPGTQAAAARGIIADDLTEILW